MGFSLVIGFIESLTSYYVTLVLLITGLLLRFGYYPAYHSREMSMDAALAKGGGYTCLILSALVLVMHFVVT
ncbi:MAG TPA: CLC_0170 family protein [Brevibacillus sp.]|nr:CLC_0170 family protein [Brevibacillus sp.]